VFGLCSLPTWLCLSLLFCSAAADERPDVAAVEKRMKDRPGEAFLLARRAADALTDQPEVRKQLFRTAAAVMDEHLAVLTEGQVSELADYHAKQAGNPAAANRARKEWLRLREAGLGPADGVGRVRLGRLHWQWHRDRDAAARLGVDALKVSPGLADARRLLQDDLKYRQSGGRWLPSEAAPPPRGRAVQRGMKPEEVVEARGQPGRIARQILYRRYLEQWFYDGPEPIIVEFDWVRGQDPHVQTVHSADPGK
jgi:hypothetical protein